MHVASTFLEPFQNYKNLSCCPSPPSGRSLKVTCVRRLRRPPWPPPGLVCQMPWGESGDFKQGSSAAAVGQCSREGPDLCQCAQEAACSQPGCTAKLALGSQPSRPGPQQCRRPEEKEPSPSHSALEIRVALHGTQHWQNEHPNPKRRAAAGTQAHPCACYGLDYFPFPQKGTSKS